MNPHPVNQGKGGAIVTAAAAATATTSSLSTPTWSTSRRTSGTAEAGARGEATVVFGSRTFGSGIGVSPAWKGVAEHSLPDSRRQLHRRGGAPDIDEGRKFLFADPSANDIHAPSAG